MSARNDLLSVLYGERPAALDAAYNGEPASREEDADMIFAFRDHERAELIRAHTASDYPRVLAAYGSAYANGWRHGRDRAADLVEEGETA